MGFDLQISNFFTISYSNNSWHFKTHEDVAEIPDPPYSSFIQFLSQHPMTITFNGPNQLTLATADNTPISQAKDSDVTALEFTINPPPAAEPGSEPPGIEHQTLSSLMETVEDLTTSNDQQHLAHLSMTPLNLFPPRVLNTINLFFIHNFAEQMTLAIPGPFQLDAAPEFSADQMNPPIFNISGDVQVSVEEYVSLLITPNHLVLFDDGFQAADPFSQAENTFDSQSLPTVTIRPLRAHRQALAKRKKYTAVDHQQKEETDANQQSWCRYLFSGQVFKDCWNGFAGKWSGTLNEKTKQRTPALILDFIP